MNQSIEQRVLKIIAKIKNISPNDIRVEQAIEEVCEDSLDVVSLLFDLEDEFEISIPDEAKELKTIQDMINGIETLIQAKRITEETPA
jgi:acyl carrier protein